MKTLDLIKESERLIEKNQKLNEIGSNLIETITKINMLDLTLENRTLLKQKHNLTDIIDEYNNKSFLYRMFNKIKISNGKDGKTV